MRIHQLSVEEALASLHSRPEGINEAEAKRRLAEFGPNQVERVETTPLLTRFLLQFTHFFALILWFAAALALFAETQQPGEGMSALATAIVGVILINGLFSFWQEYRSEQALSALRHLLPQMVAVERGGAPIERAASYLVPGDVIRLHAGDSVPADCRLIEAFGVQVNNAAITGESLPIARDASPSEEHELTSSTNVLLAGTASLRPQLLLDQPRQLRRPMLRRPPYVEPLRQLHLGHEHEHHDRGQTLSAVPGALGRTPKAPQLTGLAAERGAQSIHHKQ